MAISESVEQRQPTSAANYAATNILHRVRPLCAHPQNTDSLSKHITWILILYDYVTMTCNTRR